MACCGHLGTLLVILLFTADIFTDVATGVELLLNDHPYCKLHCSPFDHFSERL